MRSLAVRRTSKSVEFDFPMRRTWKSVVRAILLIAGLIAFVFACQTSLFAQDELPPEPPPIEETDPAAPTPEELAPEEPSDDERVVPDLAPQPMLSGELPWADTIKRTRKLPNQRLRSARQMLEMYGIDESQWLRLEDGRPLVDSEHELLYKILFRMPRFLLEDIERWQHYDPDWAEVAAEAEANRGEMYLVKGTAVLAEQIEMIPELATLYEFEHYYRVTLKHGDGRTAYVYTRRAPSEWPLGEPIEQRAHVSGMLLKVGEPPAEGPEPLREGGVGVQGGQRLPELLEREREVGGSAGGLGKRSQLLDASLDGTAGVAAERGRVVLLVQRFELLQNRVESRLVGAAARPLGEGGAETHPGVDLLGGGETLVGLALVEKRAGHLGVTVGARLLADRLAVVVEPEPGQPVADGLRRLGRRPGAVGVLDPQQEPPAAAAGVEPVEQRRARSADMQKARGRGGEAGPQEAALGVSKLDAPDTGLISLYEMRFINHMERFARASGGIGLLSAAASRQP